MDKGVRLFKNSLIIPSDFNDFVCLDPEKAAKVRQVYNELGMVNLFATYEEDSYNYIKNMINIKSRSLKPDMFLRIWEQFYRKIAVKQ